METFLALLAVGFISMKLGEITGLQWFFGWIGCATAMVLNLIK